MGKAARWFRGLLGLKRPEPDPISTSKPPKDKDKRRWSFVKSYRENKEKDKFKSSSNDVASRPLPPPAYADGEDANKHAIAVAAATAAVAEAAVAAAQAAAAVVRLTHSGRCGGVPSQAVVSSGVTIEEVRAAVVIQSYFRGYLARRALRALKGLVKLQALVRGHIMRRKTTETMRCMQAMLRAQARARSVRAYVPESPQSSRKSSQILPPGPPTPEKFEEIVRAKSGKQDQSPNKIRRNISRPSGRGHTGSSSWSDPRTDEPTWDPRGATSTRTCMTDEDRADRILEIDTGKPHFNHRRKSLFESSHSGLLTVDQVSHSYTTSKDSTHHTVASPGSCEVVQSLNPLKFSQEINNDEGLYCTAENSPQCYSATSQGGSSRRGPFTPTKSDGSRSFLSGYSDCPSYMAFTESSRAKVRSLSAPKQRPHYDRASSTKRYSIHGLGLGLGLGEHNSRSNAQRVAAMHANFASKAYPGSGRLDRLGLPVKDSTVVYYSGYLN